MHIQKLLPQYNILDFNFNSQKNIISLITPNSNQLLRLKNQTQPSLFKLIKSTQHQKHFKASFNQCQLKTSNINLNLHLHHSVYKSQNYLHIDQDYFQCRQLIKDIYIDQFGLVFFSSGNKIYLSKYLNSYDLPNKQRGFDLYSRNRQRNIDQSQDRIAYKNKSKKISILSQLNHSNFTTVSSFYTKNSLLISGSNQGIIQLWDINKSKSIYNAEYLKYSIKNIGSFLNYKDINLYYVNYQKTDKIIFCDIRTNKPIKLVNKFQADLGCEISKKGILVGLNSMGSIDLIDVNSYFQRRRIENVKQIKNIQKGLKGKSRKNIQLHMKNQHTDRNGNNQIKKSKNQYKGLKSSKDLLNNDSQFSKSRCQARYMDKYDKYQNKLQLKKLQSIITKSSKKIPANIFKHQKNFILQNKQNLITRNAHNHSQNSKIKTRKNIIYNNRKKETQSVNCSYQICSMKNIILNQCFLLTDNQIFIGKNNGQIDMLKLSKIDFQIEGLQMIMKNQNNNKQISQNGIRKINLAEDQEKETKKELGAVVKLVENYTGVYALTNKENKGSLYKVQIS